MNRKVIFGSLFLICFCCAGSAFAVGFLGTPTAELKAGQWSAGFDYTYSTQDLDKNKMKGSEDGVPYTYKTKNKDFDMNRYYGILSYGVTEDWEVNIKLGIADVKSRYKADEAGAEWLGTNFDNDFAWGWGTKYTFCKQDKVAWGVSAQMNWIDTQVTYKGVDDDGPYKDQLDMETWDLFVAVGPTVDMGGWKLYGGPFYYFLDGDLDVKGFYGDGDGGTINYKETGDIEAKDNWGGFIGAQVDVCQNWVWTVEGSFTGSGYGLGTGIAIKF
jgi:hypothetical protein